MNRTEAVTTERRRRNTAALGGNRQRLFVDESTLDRKAYDYRWVNDELGRLHNMTVNDDWEVVPDRDGAASGKNTGMGAEVAHYVGAGGQGTPLRAVLLRKPKALADADKAAAQRQIDEQEAGISRPAGEQQYVPTDGISIRQPARA